MSEPPRTIVRDEVLTTRVVISVGHVDGDPLGSFGWFIGVRGRGGRDVTGDRKRYGTCIICRRPFGEDDQVHMVFGVTRNSKRIIGNRLGCMSCAARYATIHTRGGQP
jgi:hypothetical protein